MENKINGIAIYESGSSQGLAVIFIHAFPLNHRMWEPQFRVLPSNCYGVTYDVRGHGRSEAGDGQYTIEFFVDDLIAILDDLKINQAVLCGLSLGGYIALRATERYPDRVLGLVLCDTKSDADQNEAKIKRAASIFTVKTSGVDAFASRFIESVLTEATLKNKPDITNFVLQMIQENSVLGISGTLLALAARTETTSALHKITVPVLIMVGEQDKITPPSVSEAMFKALPNAQIFTVPHAAHLSNLENPNFFNEKLLSFLKQFSSIHV